MFPSAQRPVPRSVEEGEEQLRNAGLCRAHRRLRTATVGFVMPRLDGERGVEGLSCKASISRSVPASRRGACKRCSSTTVPAQAGNVISLLCAHCRWTGGADCSSPSLSPPATLRAPRQGCELCSARLRSAGHAGSRSRLCVFVGMQADQPRAASIRPHPCHTA